MKTHYSLFYSYKNIGDVLIVIFDNEKKPTHHERKGNVEVIYHEEEVIGYNVFNIRNIVKIKTEGLIYLPSPTLVSVINTILKNSGVEELGIINHSGYVIGEIKNITALDIEKSLVSIDINEEMINAVIKNNNININDKVVVALVGTRLNSGEVVKSSNVDGVLINGHLCNEKELQISEDNKILILDKEEENGKDFFTTEVQ